MGDVSSNPRRDRRLEVVAAVLGAFVGFGVSSTIYLLVNPLLERSGGLLRETQGLLWSTVPVLTVLGAVLGHRVARRRVNGS